MKENDRILELAGIINEVKENDDSEFEYGYMADVVSNICAIGLQTKGNKEFKSEYDSRFKVKRVMSPGGKYADGKTTLNVTIDTPRGDRIIEISIKAPKK